MEDDRCQKIHTRVVDGGESVKIDGTIQIDNTHHYIIRLITESKPYSFIEKFSTLSAADIKHYLEAIETFNQWEENGFTDVNGWEYTVVNGHDDWRTPEGRYVRLSDRKYRAFTTTDIGEAITGDELTGASSHIDLVKISLAKFLYSTSAREFDYKYTKYESIRQKIQEIHGIGSNVSLSLVQNYPTRLDSYESCRELLPYVDIPKQYTRQAKNDLADRVESDDHQLIDQEIYDEYSDIVIGLEI